MGAANEVQPVPQPQTKPSPRSDDTNHSKHLHFATFSPEDAAATHLLESVQAQLHSTSHSSQCLISTDDEIAYILSLPDQESTNSTGTPCKWRIGAGPSLAHREKGIPCSEVDFLICPPGNTPGTKLARKYIKSVHAVLYLHPKSGALVLRGVGEKKPIIYLRDDDDGYDIFVNGSNSCLLYRQSNRLQFGNYCFVLNFTLDAKDQETFRVQRDNDFIRSQEVSGAYHPPSQHLDLVPSPTHWTCRDVRIHRRLSQGPYWSVYSGVCLYAPHVGDPVAVKKLRFTKQTQHLVRNELQIASMFGGSNCKSQNVLGMIERWCEHNVSPPCRLATTGESEDVYYSTQLPEHDFESMPWAKLDLDDRLAYFHQTLLGLSEMHNKGIIHGGISPSSLVVSGTRLGDSGSRPTAPGQYFRWYLPTRAAISDLAFATIGSHSHCKPTTTGVWVAPEVWTSSPEIPYTNKADVWGLAISWLRAIVRPPQNVRINERIYHALLRTVDIRHKKGDITDSFRSLLLQMLAWEPQDRPGVEEALAHEVWEPLLRRKELEKDESRRERDDRIRKPGCGVKRVRLLSPEVED